ncbi:CBD9-like protein [Curvularia clavata]|uniref:CBD9-like protein n=1 Tax=Curvularia clavata TaxID=95742 RepID=A0A9Q8ZAH8_CURCL|nr:CBD9-like protein [Curvularia clavata]
MRGSTPTSALGLLALASYASAQVSSSCPSQQVCFKLNIPQNTASSGTGDIFFQISAPSSYEWVALGQGRGMANSNMFIVYTSGSGNNVTLSPRITTSHNPPNPNSQPQVTLLEGSGVSNGVMTANVKCSNCNSWSGGTMDFKASSGNWIYGYQTSGGPKNSDDTSAQISQHSSEGAFSWDFAQAKGGSSVNPLISSTPTTSGGTGTASCRPRTSSAASTASTASSTAAASSSSTDNDNDNDDDSNTPQYGPPGSQFTGRPSVKRQAELPYCDELPNGGAANGNSNTFNPITATGSLKNRREMLIAHGVLAALAFVIFFPVGGIAIRLVSMSGIAWLHGAFQIFGYAVYIAGAGLGIYLAKNLNLLNTHHPIIGLVLLAVLFFQPALGWIHHLFFVKTQGRTFWSHAHIWVGRLAITLGIINGGLGLRLADRANLSSRAGQIAYGVVAGLMWLAWVGAIVIGERRRNRAAPVAETPKMAEERASDSDGAGHYAPRRQ